MSNSDFTISHDKPKGEIIDLGCCPEEGEAQEGTSDGYAGIPVPVKKLDTKSESFEWHVETMVEKFDGDYTAQEIAEQGIKPVEVVKVGGNMVLTAGIQRLIDQFIGATTAPFNNTNARLGVGNSNTAASAGQTDLQASAGAGNRQFKVMDATYPLRSSQTMTFKSTFASGEAQFAWLEIGIDRGTADGTTVTAPLFSRKVPSGGLGTKGAVAWALTISITPTSTGP